MNTKKTENITEENKGYDTNPQYSPDGKYIAWQSMERDGYEADLNRLFIMNLETGEKRFRVRHSNRMWMLLSGEQMLK